MALHLYRRHVTDCPHASKGQGYTLCTCPIWARGVLPDGRQVRQSLGTSDPVEADVARLRLESGQSLAASPNTLTIERAAKQYLQDCRSRQLKLSSLKSYDHTLSALVLFVTPSLPLVDIHVSHLDQFRATRTARNGKDPATATTLRKQTECIRGFLRWCLKREYIAKNPATLLSPIRGKQIPKAPFTDQEVRQLLAAIPRLGVGHDGGYNMGYYHERIRLFTLVLLYTGLRISDVIKLRRDSIDWATGYLTLRTTKSQTPVKIKLPANLVVDLSRFPAEDPSYIFFNGRNLTTNASRYRYTLQRLGELTKIHCHPHRFRHTFSKSILDNGADLRTLQLLLGHDSIKTTERHYAHFQSTQQRILDTATARLNFGDGASGTVDNSGSIKPVLIHPVKRRLANS